MPRARYDDATKAEALRLYAEHGPAEAARITGIPAPTVRSWARRNGVASVATPERQAAIEAARLTWTQRRTTLTAQLGEAAELLVNRALTSGNARDAQAWMTAAAIGIDKAQLLSGRDTPVEGVSRDERLHRLVGAVDELAARRADRAAG